MKILNSFALVPARSGSKRLPNKNIKLLNGEPLLKYSIQTALASNVDQVFVSTDSRNIQELAISCGAKAPFLRPDEFSTDEAPDCVVVFHFIGFLKSLGLSPKYIVYLRPTMPFRTVDEINACLNLISSNQDIDVVRTVIKAEYPPFWIKRIDDIGYLKPFINEISNMADLRSQDLPSTFICDGYVDVIKVESYAKYMSFNKGNVYPYFREGARFIDIDTESDWLKAERYLRDESN